MPCHNATHAIKTDEPHRRILVPNDVLSSSHGREKHGSERGLVEEKREGTLCRCMSTSAHAHTERWMGDLVGRCWVREAEVEIRVIGLRSRSKWEAASRYDSYVCGTRVFPAIIGVLSLRRFLQLSLVPVGFYYYLCIVLVFSPRGLLKEQLVITDQMKRCPIPAQLICRHWTPSCRGRACILNVTCQVHDGPLFARSFMPSLRCREGHIIGAKEEDDT